MKLRNAFFALATLTIVSTGALTGCAADADADADDADVEETADELNAAGKKLIGSYKDDSGAFKSLVLTGVSVGHANQFSADVDTGIRCITTPCPSSEHIEGTFTAGSKTITLRSTTATQFAKPLLGKYRYLAQGNKLTLLRKDFSQSLEKIVACAGLDEAACVANAVCTPKFGPSHCTPDGSICTRDIAFKGCFDKPVTPPASTCLSSQSCSSGQHCSVDDGVCNPTGMLAVCSGTCVPDAPPPPPPPPVTCMSSQSCGAGEHCSVEDGVCNSSGMLAVCSGTCVPGASKY